MFQIEVRKADAILRKSEVITSGAGVWRLL